MRRALFIGLLAATGLAAIGACARFGAESADPLEAGPPVPDGTVPDGNPVIPPADARADAPTTDFCKRMANTPPLLCDDFDDGPSTFGARWSELRSRNGGQVALDLLLPKSAPHNARATFMDDGTDGGCAYGDLKKFLVTPAAIRVGFALRLGSEDGAKAGDDAIVASVLFNAPNSPARCSVFIHASENGSTLDVRTYANGTGGGTIVDTIPVAPRAVKAVWSRYELFLSPTPNEGIQFAVEGKRVVTASLPASCLFGGDGEVTLGLFCPTGSARELRFDDVIIDNK